MIPDFLETLGLLGRLAWMLVLYFGAVAIAGAFGWTFNRVVKVCADCGKWHAVSARACRSCGLDQFCEGWWA